MYLNDTIVSDTLDCDTIYKIHVTIHRVDTVYLNDTICENDLPYILGRQNPDTIWTEDANPYYHSDTTAYGCDSTVVLTLHITPTLGKNDSTFICEDEIAEHPVVLGNLTNPWFDTRENGKYHGKWEGKWTGVKYTTDTIVWDCNHEYFHHIIVRPRQKTIQEVEYSICRGDSVQPFWPYNPIWIKTDTVIYDTIPNINPFEDTKHGGTVHNDRAYVCDSITKWTFHLTDTVHKHLYEHIREGETYVFNDSILATTGVYDSIGDYTTMDSAHNYCKAYYHLHLTVDPVYRTTDTIDICFRANREYTYVMRSQDDSTYTFKFQTPDKDTALLHFEDSLMHPSYQHYDHYFNLVVYYRQEYFKQYYDTICEGDSLRFDIHHRNNTLEQRFLKVKGIYYDTIPALNGCDSIIELYLETRDSIKTTYIEKTVTDRELPYIWTNTWYEGNVPQDSTMELRSSGIYQITMPSVHGCDSTIVMNFTVHQTHVFMDTIDVCDAINKTLSHTWFTGYEQKYTTPLADDTIYVKDTLQTRIKLDSIYVLCVNFHQTYRKQVFEKICEGDSLRFDRHHIEEESNLITERYVKVPGVYSDTLKTLFGCDSIIELHLSWYERIPVVYQEVTVTDRELPYIWHHTWHQGAEDSTFVLRETGEYTITMPSETGCDSTIVLNFTVHQTHVFRDTITICAPENRTLSHIWDFEPNYEQFFTVPDHDVDTTYEDTLVTRIVNDSIYHLYVHYHVEDSTIINATICEGDSMRFGLTRLNMPRYLKDPGTYRDTLVRHDNSCDSIIVLRLNVYPRYFNDSTKHIADIDTPYIWIHKQGGQEIARDSLYTAGDYEYRYKSQFGCDSIDSLHLFIHKTYYIHEDTINICYSETPFTWRELNNITETGDYENRRKTTEGYDSIYYVHINVWKQVYDTIQASICEGDSMRWGLTKTNHPRFVYNAGLYNDTLVSSRGCDSILVLNLNIFPRYFNDSTKHIADVDTPYVWIHKQGGQEIARDSLYAAGRYGYRYESTLGCDSIDSLTLVIHPTYLFKDTVTICYDQTPYTWYNADHTQIFQEGIYETGTYIKRLQTHDLYDSTYVRYVRVIPVIHDTVRHAMCEGTDYLFNGVRYTEGGTYTDTLVSNYGCDSIVTLILTVNKSIFVRIPADIYEGETYMFYGQPYTTSGTYRHYGHTPEGCDSIAELFLTVHPQIDTIVTICKSELPYTWVHKWSGQERLLYSQGIYRDDTTVVNDQRTFYTLQLVVNEPLYDTIRASICQEENDFYEFRGQRLTTTGIYHDTITGSNGCDSITTLYLTVNKPYYNYIERHIVEGQSVEVLGQTYSNDTLATFRGLTPAGCDSITDVRIIMHPLVDTTVVVCSDDLPYRWINKWNGQETLLFAAGLYRNDTTMVNGKPMYYGLKLIVNDPIQDTIRHAMCEGASYEFKGNTYDEAGIYRDTLTAANGCDSIVTLILTVNKPYYNIIKENILEGQYYVFYGDTIRESTTVNHSARTPEGCDSTTVLQLTVHPLVDTVINVCDNDLPVIWNNRWSGKQESYYTYRSTLTIRYSTRSVTRCARVQATSSRVIPIPRRASIVTLSVQLTVATVL